MSDPAATRSNGKEVALLRRLLRLLDSPHALRRRIANRLIRSELAECGRGVRFNPEDRIAQAGNIHIGDDVFIGDGAVISVMGGARLRLEDGVTIGPRVMIIGGDHNFRIIGRQMKEIHEGIDQGEIVLGADVWCGANVTVLKQVHVGEGSVVGAGSVVTRSLPPFVICVGNPCRPVALRFRDDQLHRHLISLRRTPQAADETIEIRRQAVATSGLTFDS